MSSEYQIGHEGEFTYRGHTLEELDCVAGRHALDLPGDGLAVLVAHLTLPEHRFRRCVRVDVD